MIYISIASVYLKDPQKIKALALELLKAADDLQNEKNKSLKPDIKNIEDMNI